MRRFWSVLLTCVLLLMVTTVPAALAVPENPTVEIGGHVLVTQGYRGAHFHNERIYVPVADFANLLGMQWSWDNATAQLTFAGRPVSYAFSPAPHLHDERVYAPVRVLAEMTGATVTWNDREARVVVQPAPARKPSVAEIAALLKEKQIVDLTHAFGPGIPHWYGFGDEQVKELYTVKKDGFLVQEFTHVGQWGTHVDPPAHFHAGLRTVDQIPPSEMLLPLVVLDVHEQVAKNPDYTVTMADVMAWEAKHGPVPAGSFVALRTDWSKRWPDQAKMLNKDAQGTFHYPGWSMPVLKYLYEERKVTASGHETTDTDPGLATTHDDYSLESYILSLNHYQIEMLTNLDQVPEAGALAIVAFPKPQGGSGFPARVLAVVP
jgi:kynurenine formamidase